ncbi:hypothetical protein H0H87_003294, partial [Tephrocybe sp. NHM501043]
PGKKRKREASPDLPEKRLALDKKGSSSSGNQNRTQLPSTEILEGLAADEWRKKLIQVMFPGTRVKPEKILRDRDDPNLRPWKKKEKGSGSVTPVNAPASPVKATPLSSSDTTN